MKNNKKKIVDENGQPVGVDVEGELAIKVQPKRPVFLFSEYINDEERTRKAHLGDYYLTGDRASADKDGYIWFNARSDDVIITAGKKIQSR